MSKQKYFLLACCCMFCLSCSGRSDSVLSAQTDNTAVPLVALNANARDARVSKPKNSAYMYFAFPEEVSFETEGKSLEISISLLKPSGAQNAETEDLSLFCYGWLYEDDFISPYKLKKKLGNHSYVNGSCTEDFSVSLAFPEKEKICGFFVYSALSLAVSSVKITPIRIGWEKTAEKPWFGFDESGGTISLQNMSVALPSKSAMKLSVYLRSFERGQKNITVAVGSKPVTIRQAPDQDVITLYPAVMRTSNAPMFASVTDGENYVGGMIYEKVKQTNKNVALAPIVTDPGAIVYWPQETWRIEALELFEWEQFPQILFFDTANYHIQDLLFKRLAFFAEKGGYTGKLVTDSIMEGQHGFNAHDYRAETLAAFFELARMNNFPLNEYEILLQDILIAQGIIVRRGDGTLGAGLGAIVSISKESNMYLRNMFVTHEGLHCLFFTDADFRKKVAEVYNSTDEMSLQFLLRYFAETPSLNYDLKDIYLVRNEFMSYMMQQSIEDVAEYFTKILATKKSINGSNPELVEYILKTNAQGFVQSASLLNKYLSDRWGYAGGRISLVNYKIDN